MDKKVTKVNHEQPGVKVRLLSAANTLFLKKGYSNTGVREIMKLAKVVPASFYDHFPSKVDLGRAYIVSQKEIMIEELSFLSKRFKNEPTKFLKTWGLFQKKKLYKGEFYGCQFARIAYQLREEEKELKFELKNIAQAWKDFLKEYFFQFLSPSSTDKLTDEMMVWIEGTYSLWMISSNAYYLELLNTKLKNLWNEYSEDIK
ncbi:MAG: TetR/AcrR family transcriptional regulator [Leptospiraceae bacterium]|nr:TetR/AcrR family transcriptional regulator [Leptospiraceae bacterium]